MESKRVVANLKRVQGQVGGVVKMVEAGKSCEEILTQISAAMSSLKSVGRMLMADQAGKCKSEEYDRLLRRYL